MTESTSGDPEPEWDGNAEPGPSDRPRSGVTALIAGRSHRSICTIYPPDVAAPYRSTTWITAYGDSFVDLDDCR
ncbi:hypothetical protein A6E15_18770 [Natrinema saccharevitans]|uniref:DUF7511 domain-containing protein n=1 Tax=Natrinema saccharevitans TaxID=301967 RepID=A0A1S8AS89_9EURY|nr:hypothetical protein A6E15_18770 [Natrinema saccharevitans]